MKKMKKMKKFICCMLSVCMVAGILSLNLPVKEVKAVEGVTPVEYTVNVKSTGTNGFVLCNKVPVAKGTKVTLTYTVASTNLPSSFTTDEVNWSHLNGLVGLSETELNKTSRPKSDTTRWEKTFNRVVRNEKKHSFTLWLNDSGQIEFIGGAYDANGTLEDYTAANYFNAGKAGYGTEATQYLGICANANTNVKLTNVTCVDENGNNLGVRINAGADGTVKVTEQPTVEYTVNVDSGKSDWGPIYLRNETATTGKVTMSYTVESSVMTFSGNNGLMCVTSDAVSNSKNSSVVSYNSSNKMFKEGYSYEITMWRDSTGTKIAHDIRCKKPDGTNETITLRDNTADLSGETYFGIFSYPGVQVQLTHVTCVDEAGNDLGLVLNNGDTSKGTVTKVVQYTVDTTSQNDLGLLLCNKTPVAKGGTVTWIWTVDEFTGTYSYNGFVGTTQGNLETYESAKYTIGALVSNYNRVMKQGETYRFTLGYDETAAAWKWSGGRINRVTGAIVETYAVGVHLPGFSGNEEDGTKFLGIRVSGNAHVKLSNVSCVDQNGKDLGIQMNRGANGAIVQNDITTENRKMCAYSKTKFEECRAATTAPVAISGYAFAGWYKDEGGINPITDDEVIEGLFAYAKYVPEDVLSVKLQLTKGTTTGSIKTDMRLITSVDSTQYQLVGFAVTAKVTVDGEEKNQTKKYEQSTCYSTLNGAGLTYYPREFHDASESFITSLLKDMPISGTDMNKEITITPYWKTMDGTTYYGVSRTITKQQALDAAAAAS